MLLPTLLLAAATAVDGEAALRHASALAALGPHPWGSPRGRVAAEYVAAQFRDAGLEEVRLEAFEEQGLHGANVVGVLRAPGPEMVVIGAHHDTAPESPGAYDAGGGVGVVVEVARVLARSRERQRTVVFVSWDGEEAWAAGKGLKTAGSREWLRSLRAESRHVVAAFVVEMSGWARGTPVVMPIAYEDPLRPGASVVAPGWLVRAALEGAERRGSPYRVGDPWLSWLFQPVVRTVRVRLYGDDLSFLQAGVPALFATDSSFSAFYPWYHQAEDTPDKLDAAALARQGRAVLGVAEALQRVRGAGKDPHFFVAFGHVVGWWSLLALAAASVGPGLYLASRRGAWAIAARLGQAAAFGFLWWRHPVPALWAFLLPNLVTAWRRDLLAAVPSLLPLLALVGLAVATFWRGMASGLWLGPWDLGAAALALGLLWAGPGAAGKGRRKAARRARR